MLYYSSIAILKSLCEVLRFGSRRRMWSILVVSLVGPLGVFAQAEKPLNMKENLLLIRTIENGGVRYYMPTFTSSDGYFVLVGIESESAAIISNGVKRPFSPCTDSKFVTATLDKIGKRLAVSCEDYSVEVWNVLDLRISRRLQSRPFKPENFFVPYISPDGERVVLRRGEVAELWNVGSGKKVADLNSYAATDCYCNSSIYSVVFSPDGKVVAIAFGGMVFLWNADNGELVSRLIDKGYDEGRWFADGVIPTMIFTKDRQRIITGSVSGNAKIWNVETGELIRKFKKHKLGITALALSPDEKVLATGSRNQDVKLWDLESGRELFSLKNRKEVRRLSFRPDGARLMSMTSTHAFIWDVSTGKVLEEMPIVDPLTTSISPDWTRVLMVDKKTKILGLYEYTSK